MKRQQVKFYSPENYRMQIIFRDFGNGSFGSHVGLEGLKSVTEPMEKRGNFPEFQSQDELQAVLVQFQNN